MRGLALAAVVACAAAASACGSGAGDRVSDRYPALGTLIEITVVESDARERAAAFRDARAVFARATRDWHAWGGGELARVNAGTGLPSPELARSLAHAEALAVRSERLFEPGVGALVEAWGFHAGERAPGPPPDEAALAAARAAPVVIDLGAYAKGAAVAVAVAALRAAGIEHALVNAGGDLAALGDAGGRAWRVGVRDPHRNGVVATADLHDGEAVFTSGGYERGFDWNGIRYHHLLDPRTGRPARASASFTVIHRDPATADAAVTALFIAGDDWPRIATQLGIEYALRITPDGAAEATPAMVARLTMREGVALTEVPLAAAHR